MELLYLWIDNYKNIEEQGFDFSSKLKFSITNLNKDGPIKTMSLKIDFNPNYIKLFPAGIVNITGIVGENASGKSNLLDCIKLLSGRLPDITSSLAFCILNHQTNTIETYYYKSGDSNYMVPLNIDIQATNSVKQQFKVGIPVGYTVSKDANRINSIPEFEMESPVSTCCFISNTFDSRNERLFTNIINVSTNYRLEEFLRKYIRDFQPKTKTAAAFSDKNIYKTHLTEYHRKELRTLLSFIAYANTRQIQDLPELPQFLIISFNFDELEYIITHFSRSSQIVNTSDLRVLHKKALEFIISGENKGDQFYNLIILCSLYYALRWDFFKPNLYSGQKVSRKIYEFSRISDSVQLFEEILKLLSPLKLMNTDVKKHNLQELLGDKMKKAIQKIEFIDESFVSNPIRFKVKIEKRLWPLLNLIHTFRYIEPSSFINYQWENLSSGQEAFYLQFGRLNEIKPDIHQKIFWLLIDEGDLYFHPQWQREYIKRLVEFVNFTFPRKKVQIFLTSHSPFIASDLPKTNLIFLDRGPSNKCIVTDISSHKLTLGANIHMLYTDTFFLRSVIGSFAKDKIDQFINWVMDDKANMELAEYYGKFIKQIGEPILSAKLIELYAIKMGDDYEVKSLENIKSKIETRLAEIKSKNDPD